jgi:hypothetical protein
MPTPGREEFEPRINTDEEIGMFKIHIGLMFPSSFESSQNSIDNPVLSVCIRVHPWFSFSFRQFIPQLRNLALFTLP